MTTPAVRTYLSEATIAAYRHSVDPVWSRLAGRLLATDCGVVVHVEETALSADPITCPRCLRARGGEGGS